MPEQEKPVDKRVAAREVVDILYEISSLLNTRLSRPQLSFCVSLIENGVNPEALASVVTTLRKEYPESSAPSEDE